jgi:hypothetical protein
MTGAIPVTKIVPARPITKAPHQPVSRFNPPEAYCSSSEAEVFLESGAMDLHLHLLCRAEPGDVGNYTTRK